MIAQSFHWKRLMLVMTNIVIIYVLQTSIMAFIKIMNIHEQTVYRNLKALANT